MLIGNNETAEPRKEDYDITDAMSDHAVTRIRQHAANKKEMLFFQYIAYTAPHWPLHTFETNVEKYKRCFDCGWDKLWQQRLQQMVAMESIDHGWRLSRRDPAGPLWDGEKHKNRQVLRMQLYAAQIDRMDRGVAMN